MTSQQIASIVDAHVHFWNLGRLSYPWLAADAPPRPFGDHGPIKRSYQPDDYRIDLHGLTLEACVHIQANCADPRGETLWLEECAQRTGLPTALIAFVDLRHPRAEEELEWLAARPPGLARGVRQLLNWHDEPLRRATDRFDLMDDAAFRSGFARLERYGFVFDLGCLPAQLQMACRLADDFPGVTMALNHLGWPILSDSDGVARWRSGMRDLARRPNVALKVSGLWPIERRWAPERLRPFVRDAIDWFGFDRCMYGSNFPIEKLMTPVPDQVSTLLAILDDVSGEELAKFFKITAQRVYRLP